MPDGFAVYAIDHRGHGRSDGRRAQIDRMAHVVEDLDRLVDRANAASTRSCRCSCSATAWAAASRVAYALEHQDRSTGLALSGAAGGASRPRRCRCG